jgi:hypothetical protein
MKKYTVIRTGEMPLQFEGELLWEETSKERPEDSRWHELRLYRTENGKYVVEILSVSTYRHEGQTSSANVFDTLKAACREFLDFPPFCCFKGYPPWSDRQEDQAKLEDWVCRRYREAASRLVDRLGPADIVE